MYAMSMNFTDAAEAQLATALRVISSSRFDKKSVNIIDVLSDAQRLHRTTNYDFSKPGNRLLEE